MKLVFVDIETNGLDFFIHVPIDIAVVVVDLSDLTKQYAYTSCIMIDASDWLSSDPDSMLINGYTEHNLFPCKTEFEVSKDLEEFLLQHEIQKGKSFFICQNPSFDRPFFHQLLSAQRMNDLNMPYHWLDLASMFWMKYCAKNAQYLDSIVSLSKDSIAEQFGIPSEEKPHKALRGVMHLIKCYFAIAYDKM